MPAKDLGNKHVCFKCGIKFYDFKKPAAVCPKCGADQRESPALRPPPSERRAKAPPKPPPEPVVEPADEESELDEDLEEGDEEEVAESDDEG